MIAHRLIHATLLITAAIGASLALSGCTDACGATVKRAAFRQTSSCSNNSNDVVAVNVTPGNDTIAVGGSVLLHAVAVDINGSNLSITSFNWSSSNTSIATVDNSGLITAVAVGTATISAQTSGETGHATIVVTAGGGSAELTGRVYNA